MYGNKKNSLLNASILTAIAVWVIVCQVSAFDPAAAGERNLGQEYTWHLDNASGRAGVTYHYAVYDYRVIGNTLTYYSPSWGQWLTRTADPGKEYFAIWIRGWLNGTAWYGWDADRFKLWAWSNTTIDPEPVHMQDAPIRYNSDRYLPEVYRETENRTPTLERGILTAELYGWKDEIQMTRMEPGQSNAFDGYVLYQKPRGAKPEDLRVLMWLWGAPSPIWYLTEHKIIQPAPWMKTDTVIPSIGIRGGTTEDTRELLRGNVR